MAISTLTKCIKTYLTLSIYKLITAYQIVVHTNNRLEKQLIHEILQMEQAAPKISLNDLPTLTFDIQCTHTHIQGESTLIISNVIKFGSNMYVHNAYIHVCVDQITIIIIITTPTITVAKI